MIRQLTSPKAWAMLIGIFVLSDSFSTWAAFLTLGSRTPEENIAVVKLYQSYGAIGAFMWSPFEYASLALIVAMFGLGFWFGKKVFPIGMNPMKITIGETTFTFQRLSEYINNPSELITLFLLWLFTIPITNLITMIALAVK